MSKDFTIIFVVSYFVAFLLLYRYYRYYKIKKNMTLIKCHVTDKTYHTGYDKNTYIFYYEYTYKKEVYNESDSIRFKLFYNPDIKDELNIYVRARDPKITITPYKILLYRIYLFIAILLLIVPLLFII